MRVQSLFILCIILLLNNCTKNSGLPPVSFNDSTYLKCHIRNCQTSGNITLSYASICPLELNEMKVSYISDTIYLIALLINHPVTINLESADINASCFNLPKDTLDVFIDLSPAQKQKVTFRGKCASISNYLSYTKKNISSVPKYFQTVREYTSQIDYSVQNALYELHRFDSKTQLPRWFVKMEELDIRYSGARDKVYQFKMRQRFNFQYRLIPDGYLENLDVKLYNPKAIYSLSYFGFLNNYSTLDLYDYLGRQNLNSDDTYFYILENLKAGQRFLHSDLKELYTAQRISALISKRLVREALDSSDSLYFQRVDSLIKSAQNSFKDEAILNSLIDFRKKQFNIEN